MVLQVFNVNVGHGRVLVLALFQCVDVMAARFYKDNVWSWMYDDFHAKLKLQWPYY